jgi:mannose-6-phosphate isomerase
LRIKNPHDTHLAAEGDRLHVEILSWPTVYDLTHALTHSLIESGNLPHALAAIYDPAAAGGYAVAAQMAALLREADAIEVTEVALVHVVGRGNARRVTQLPTFPEATDSILLVDDVSWSGNTIHMARQALTKVTDAEIKTCALLAGAAAAQEGYLDYYGRLSDAREAQFPWGLVSPTAEVHRYIDGSNQGSRHDVSWAPRPWGYWEQFAYNQQCTVRVLTILPGECLSLQYHANRDEFFVVLDDGVAIEVGDDTVEGRKGDYIFVPRMTPHRYSAPKSHPVRLLEVSFGDYDQIGDIVRIEDRYGRQGRDGSI